MALTLAEATTIATAALEAGRAEAVQAVSVVVTDPGGCVRVALRGDAAGLFGLDIALAKAVTALGFNRPSSAMGKVFGANAAAVAGLTAATGGRFLALAGGVLVFADDVLVGAVGVAGSLPENDERFAVAGVVAGGFVSPG